jgi:hypothetical protein
MADQNLKYKNHELNSLWVLWYHNPNNSGWDLSSYHKVMELRKLHDFWDMFTLLKTSHFQNGMFFLMRNDIKPMWEDRHNVDGGCWSFRVNKKEVPKTWQELVIGSLGESLMRESKYYKTINGISISPKRSFSILKIWNNNVKINESTLLKSVEGLNMNEIIYKPHVESIDKDREKRLNKQKNDLKQNKPKEEEEEEEGEEEDMIMYNEHQARLKEMLG